MARKPIPLGAPPPNPPHTLDVGITRTHSGAGSTLPQDRTGSSSVPPPQPHASEAIEQAGPGPSSLPPSPGNSSDSQEADTSTQVPVLPGEAPQKRPRTVYPPPRAALPEPIPPSELLFPDRTSGPVHPPNSAGHFQYEVGENLTARFKIMRKFGEGTFGQVLECWDRRRGEYVALKVIRCVQVGSGRCSGWEGGMGRGVRGWFDGLSVPVCVVQCISLQDHGPASIEISGSLCEPDRP